MLIASTWSCVTYTSVRPRSRCRYFSSARICSRSSASSAESGSSSRYTSGARTRQRPIATRWRSPPERCAGRRFRSGSICSSAAVSLTRRSISEEETFSLPCRSGNARLSYTVLSGYSARFWNTMETLRSLGTSVGDVGSADQHRALLGPLQTDDGAQQRRLARARRAEDAEELAVGDVELDVIERSHLPEALGHVRDLDPTHQASASPAGVGEDMDATGVELEPDRLADAWSHRRRHRDAQQVTVACEVDDVARAEGLRSGSPSPAATRCPRRARRARCAPGGSPSCTCRRRRRRRGGARRPGGPRRRAA